MPDKSLHAKMPSIARQITFDDICVWMILLGLAHLAWLT